MPRSDDYLLTIEEVAKRLNKSIRTVHRYKDDGRLSYQVGTTQGNPLYFSRSEVDGLARELYPHLSAAGDGAGPDQALADRLERVERVLASLDRHPVLMRLLHLASAPDGTASAEELESALKDLASLRRDGQPVDRKELGQWLVRMGNNLLK